MDAAVRRVRHETWQRMLQACPRAFDAFNSPLTAQQRYSQGVADLTQRGTEAHKELTRHLRGECRACAAGGKAEYVRRLRVRLSECLRGVTTGGNYLADFRSELLAEPPPPRTYEESMHDTFRVVDAHMWRAHPQCRGPSHNDSLVKWISAFPMEAHGRLFLPLPCGCNDDDHILLWANAVAERNRTQHLLMCFAYNRHERRVCPSCQAYLREWRLLLCHDGEAPRHGGGV